MLTGKCLCGTVRFSVEDRFLYAGYCHCSQCRQSSGSAFNAFAGVRHEALQVTSGQESISTYLKSEESVLNFCKVCGSNLFSVKSKSGLVNIRMGTLIDNPHIRPMAHYFVGSKAPWHEIDDALPQFAERSPRDP